MKILAAFNFHAYASSVKIVEINCRWNVLVLQYGQIITSPGQYDNNAKCAGRKFPMVWFCRLRYSRLFPTTNIGKVREKMADKHWQGETTSDHRVDRGDWAAAAGFVHTLWAHTQAECYAGLRYRRIDKHNNGPGWIPTGLSDLFRPLFGLAIRACGSPRSTLSLWNKHGVTCAAQVLYLQTGASNRIFCDGLNTMSSHKVVFIIINTNQFKYSNICFALARKLTRFYNKTALIESIALMTWFEMVS